MWKLRLQFTRSPSSGVVLPWNGLHASSFPVFRTPSPTRSSSGGARPSSSQAFFEKGNYAPCRDVLAEAGARDRTTGQLWQGRYGPVVMDGDRLLDAVRCVTRNPACAKGAQTGRALMSARRGPKKGSGTL